MNRLTGEITNPNVLRGRQLFAFGPDKVFLIDRISFYERKDFHRLGME